MTSTFSSSSHILEKKSSFRSTQNFQIVAYQMSVSPFRYFLVKEDEKNIVKGYYRVKHFGLIHLKNTYQNHSNKATSTK